ncbi:hypothetical protein FSB78_00710 [Sphingomonas ginsenosidivorax]|uniref:Flagellar export protein FliJ n=1 Tax=Sphingomonas ginsenosidivorax TaxID=862135 RepID=A0A5C6UC09_9SPHN|nr:hypothetical protein [Sphingomonas ginsenosidivorax]TXC69646.1 hypothetical protein FSB78_00710 [Sphingomonas ginsenosidivorax]
MITPYDAALRLRQREMDAVRLSISVEVNQIVLLDRHRDTIDRTVRQELSLAGSDPMLSAHAFAGRMRAQREALGRDRQASDGRLAVLRAQAADAYGAVRAIEGAALRHREDAARLAAVAEQSQMDDFAAAGFARARHAARRARATDERLA